MEEDTGQGLWRPKTVLLLLPPPMDLLTCCLPCLLSTTPTIRINSASFQLLSVLGEGSYSVVYLVQCSSGAARGRYALKKIRTISTLSTQRALKEVAYYGQFRSPYLIRALDSSSIQEPDGSRSIYILLPYYAGGSLQDLVNSTIFDPGLRLAEHDVLRLFVAVCRGVLTLHRYHAPHAPDDDGAAAAAGTTQLAEAVPYAHYDLKPDNIFVARDGTPVIGDLGSCSPARIHITSRAQAVSFQELVAENSTPEFRAPELFDVRPNDSFDERVDIWSLGCLLYTMLFGVNPFVREVRRSGANLKLAVQAGRWSFPDQDPDDPDTPVYSDLTTALVRQALTVDKEARPSTDTVLAAALAALAGLDS